jgi:VWFA-related protein
VSRTLLRSALAFGWLATLAAGSPTPGQTPLAGYGESLDVELVTVEVWVSDRDGQPVASDFTLRHDGEVVPITHFSEVRAGAAAPPPVTPGVETVPPAATPSPAASPAGYLVFYFDQLHLRPRDYEPLLAAVRQQLAAAQVPAERVMLLRQDRELHLEVPFGATAEALDAGLQRIAAARGIGDAADADQLLSAIGSTWTESEQVADAANRGAQSAPGGERFGGGGPRSAVGGAGTSGAGGRGAPPMTPPSCDVFVERMNTLAQGWVRERQARAAITMGHLYQAGTILAGLPGMKTLVYLSDSLETEPAMPLTAVVTALCPGQSLDMQSPEMSKSLLALTRHLNSNQVTLHALQASGLQVGESGSASSRALSGGMGAARAGSAFDAARRASERSGMGALADETGGRLVFNRNDLAPDLERIGRDMGSYYSLAYAPPPSTGGGEHRIEVTLGQRGLETRYRRGYQAKSGEQRLLELLEGALYLGLNANPLGVRLGAGEIRAKGDRFVLPLHLFVPVDRLAFLGPADKPSAELRLQVLARHTAGPSQATKGGAFRVARPASGTGTANVGVELELERGRHVVAVAVRDEAARTVSLVSTTLDVGQ